MTENELDAVLVRALSRLPGQRPTRGFDDRVLSRVQLAAPRPVLAARRLRSWALQPQRALALAGAYAVLATIALAVSIPWLVANVSAVRTALDWVVVRGVAIGREAFLTSAQWTVSSGLTQILDLVPRQGPVLWAAALLAAAGYAGCAVGLHLLLRAPGPDRASVRVDA
jgi:hypothetical protein